MWSSDNQLLRHIAGPPTAAPMTMSSQQQGSQPHSREPNRRKTRRKDEKQRPEKWGSAVQEICVAASTVPEKSLPGRRRRTIVTRKPVPPPTPSFLLAKPRRRHPNGEDAKTQTDEGEGPARLLRISPLRNANNLSTPLLRRRSSKQKSGSPPARKNGHGKPANLTPNFDLQGYSDSDWAGSIDDMKTKFISATAAINHALWLRKIISHLHLEQKASTKVMVDNQTDIAISNNPIFHGKTKHFSIKLFFIKNVQKGGTVWLKYCKTKDQLAYIFTKPLAKGRFEDLRERLEICIY
nr:Copia protein [Ipomoea batatas]